MSRFTALLCLITSCLTFALFTEAKLGFDSHGALSARKFRCLKQKGYEYVIMRVFHSYGKIDLPGIKSLVTARQEGLAADGYLFPCFPCGNPEKQMDDTAKGLKDNNAVIDTLWLDIENYKWSSNKTANQLFILRMIVRGKSLGLRLGIYSGWNPWHDIVGTHWSFGSSQGLKLWYAHWDKRADFDDFKLFGGWTRPDMKQFVGNSHDCFYPLDKNWKP